MRLPFSAAAALSGCLAAVLLCAAVPAAARTPEVRAALAREREALLAGPQRTAEGLPAARRIALIDQALAQEDWPTAGRAVVVNVAEGRAFGLDNGSVAFETAVIVGKTSTRTPLFEAEAVAVTFNPTWSIPPSLRREEGGRSSVGPGPSNPLGHVRVDMPNRHNVYLHDTNRRDLFARKEFTFSHGCVRMADPAGMARWLLGEETWRAVDGDARVRGWASRRVALAGPVPVRIEYRTADVGADGRVVYFDDPYGYARRR